MTVGDAKKRALQLINEYSGMATNYTTDDDYRTKLCACLNFAQKQVATVRPLKKTVNYFMDEQTLAFCTPIETAITHRATDIEYTVDAAFSYYFEVDNNCTVKIYVGDTETISITNTDGKGWKVYKGFIDGTGAVRIVFSGAFLYRFKNVALFNVNFPYTTTIAEGTSTVVKNTDQIPNYTVYYDLPNDFISVIKVYEGDSPAVYAINGNKILIYPSEREITLLYAATPSDITDETDNATALEIDIEAQEAVVYGAVADLLKDDTGNSAYAVFENKYNTLLQNLGQRNTMSFNVVRLGAKNGI